jgi:hypothetical protein
MVGVTALQHHGLGAAQRQLSKAEKIIGLTAIALTKKDSSQTGERRKG